MNERVLRIPCAGESLVGILAEPAEAASDLAVLIVVGGPQYRVGSHRQFTLLARHLAANGFPVLRFDYRSMGDSPGEPRDFLGVNDDIGAAIDALLAACPGQRRVAIWGLCDAASAALLYLHQRPDARVAGLALLNPWVRSAATLAQTHIKHYYWRRLRDRSFWAKLLRGGIGGTALRTLASNVRLARDASAPAATASFQDRMAAGLRAFRGRTLLVLSGDDYTAREFMLHAAGSAAWADLLDARAVTRHDLPGNDHTFSGVGQAQHAAELTLDWLRAF